MQDIKSRPCMYLEGVCIVNGFFPTGKFTYLLKKIGCGKV